MQHLACNKLWVLHLQVGEEAGAVSKGLPPLPRSNIRPNPIKPPFMHACAWTTPKTLNPS